jgi:histidine phosphotransferase ChpT
MKTDLDIRVVELLCSRLCHELVSPVGAINNGVELIEEMGAEMADEAIGLIAHSADQASRRLRLLRLAYGTSGSDKSGLAEAAQAAEGYFAGSKIKLEWLPGRLEQAGRLHPGSGKVLLNLVILAEEALAYGGRIVVEPASDGSPVVAAVGRNAGLKDETAQALADDIAIENLTPRTVHAYVTGCFARHLDLNVVTARESSERFAFHLQS